MLGLARLGQAEPVPFYVVGGKSGFGFCALVSQSIEKGQMNAHHTNTDEIERIDVSKHARSRYLERVGFDPYPAEAIRELLADAEPDHDHEQVSDAVAFVADECIVVADRALETVTTVLRPGAT